MNTTATIVNPTTGTESQVSDRLNAIIALAITINALKSTDFVSNSQVKLILGCDNNPFRTVEKCYSLVSSNKGQEIEGMIDKVVSAFLGTAVCVNDEYKAELTTLLTSAYGVRGVNTYVKDTDGKRLMYADKDGKNHAIKTGMKAMKYNTLVQYKKLFINGLVSFLNNDGAVESLDDTKKRAKSNERHSKKFN